MTEPSRPAPSTTAPSAAPDPWAPGGVMSTTNPPSTPRLPTGPATTAEREPDDGRDRNGRRVDRRSRRGRIVAAGAVVLLAIGAGIALSVDRGPTPTVDEPARAAPRRGAFPGESMNLDPGADVTGPATEPGVVPPTVDVISIADDLRSIAPTEIVALSAGRGLVEVSLPSGRVRTTDLRLATEQPGVTTTDFGALVWARDESDSGAATYLVIAEGGRSTPIIGTTRLAEARSTPTRDEFFLWAPETSTPTVITADGRIEARPAATDRPIPSGPIDPGGGVLDQDTGGVYRTDESGTVRLSTGDLLATGRNHVLVHECDSRRTCRLVVIDGALDTGGDRRRNSAFTTGDLADDHPVWSPLHDGLAPDGSAFLAVSDTDRRELSIVSATDGTITPVYASSSFELHAAWASDSSGVFFADGALRFFRRADAVVTLVSDVLPEVRMVTTRVPRRSVTCELAIAAAARFDGMRTGTEVGAPSGESLDALRMTAPSELAAATDALATFVGAFVSAERTDSERIENWPANVRAGIDAIDRFARTDC